MNIITLKAHTWILSAMQQIIEYFDKQDKQGFPLGAFQWCPLLHLKSSFSENEKA